MGREGKKICEVLMTFPQASSASSHTRAMLMRTLMAAGLVTASLQGLGSSVALAEVHAKGGAQDNTHTPTHARKTRTDAGISCCLS